jgi:hypothetical protein
MMIRDEDPTFVDWKDRKRLSKLSKRERAAAKLEMELRRIRSAHAADMWVGRCAVSALAFITSWQARLSSSRASSWPRGWQGLHEPYSGVFAFPVAVEWQGYLLCSPFHATVLTLVPSRSVSSRFELTRLFARSVNKPEAPRHFPLHPALAPKQGKAGLVPVAPASTASPLDALIACVAASMPLPS